MGGADRAAALGLSGGAWVKHGYAQAHALKQAEFKRNLIMVIFWFAVAGVFGGGVFLTKGREAGFEFFAGYLVEKALSVDNLFVFILLFDYFKVPLGMQKRALNYGIVGAVVMRGFMIAAGVAAIERFRSIILLFAAILVASSFKLLTEHSGDEEDAADNAIVKLAQRLCNAVHDRLR